MLARLVPILVGLALLLPTVAVAQAGDADDRSGRNPDSVVRTGEPRSPTALERSARNGSDDGDDEDDKRGRRESNGPGVGIGSFDVAAADGTVKGDFVTFDYMPASIENATAGGIFLFRAEITGLARFEGDDGPRGGTPDGAKSRGSVVSIGTAAYRLRAHDNPNAIFDVVTSDAFAISFPAGTTLRAHDGFVEVLYPDGRTGRVFTDEDELAIVGARVTGEDGFKFMLDVKRGSFDANRADIGRAMAKRHVGAEVTIGKPDGPAGKLREEIVTFGNVTISTRAQRGNVTLVVEGHGFDGRVLVVNVDPSLFGVSHKKDFLVLFDNATISEASNFTDAMNPDDDGLRPEYLLVAGADGVQLVVTIPHYSVHTLTLAELIVEAPPSVIVGFVAGTVLVAAGGFVLFRRPKGA